MESTAWMKFLGTAGARYIVARQIRASGGIFLSSGNKKIILDPGPGALVRCARSKPQIDPFEIDAIILTHAHIDHSNDVNVMIDAMTEGGCKKRGVLFAPREALEGEHAVVLRYLREFLQDIITIEEEKEYCIGNVRFCTSIRHHHPAETYGIQILMPGGKISFMSDTAFFPGLVSSYANTRVLIVNVVRYKPHESREIQHLNVEDVQKLIEGIKPAEVILTHFGQTMIKAKPWVVAEELEKECGIPVKAASDGMLYDLQDS